MPLVCEIYDCSDHDSDSCSCHISTDSFAMIASMIKTMNDQQVKFANCMRKYDLSHMTDLRVNFSKLDVNLCDDSVSSLTLESRLEEVHDPPLTTLSLVTPSLPSTLRDNTPLYTTYLDPPFPLAQLTEFEGAATCCVDASVNEDDMCCKSDDAFIEVHDLDETLIERSCVDVVVAVSSSPDCVDLVSPDPLDIFHASLLCSLPSSSLECCDLSSIDSHVVLEENEVDCSKSLGTFRGYDPSLNLYRLYLEDMPGKIMLIIAFDCFADFSKAFDKFSRALIDIPRFIFWCSYLHSSELYAQVFDELLQALASSELVAWILRWEEWLMLLQPSEASS